MRGRWWLVPSAFSTLLVVFGISDLAFGVASDPTITRSLTGSTPDEIRASSEAGYRAIDFGTRSNAATLGALGAVLASIAAGPYRRGQRWAWTILWALPAWAVAVFIINVAFGIAPGQGPSAPMISAPIVAVIVGLALVMDRSRFTRVA